MSRGSTSDPIRVSTHWRGAVPIVLMALCALGLGAAIAVRHPDEWVGLVATGDRLATVGGTMATRYGDLTPRAAYLLAFQAAQDQEDVPRMLVVADRLDRLGERDLAAHVRRAASSLRAARAP